MDQSFNFELAEKQITVWFNGILKSVSFPNSQIYGWFIGYGITSVQVDLRKWEYRFEIWTPILEFEKDIDLRIGTTIWEFVTLIYD
jgi:hypothetical protein